MAEPSYSSLVAMGELTGSVSKKVLAVICIGELDYID